MKILEENDAICPSQVRDSHLEIILRSYLKQKFPYLFFSSVIAVFWEKCFANCEHATGGQSVSLETRTRTLGTSIRESHLQYFPRKKK